MPDLTEEACERLRDAGGLGMLLSIITNLLMIPDEHFEKGYIITALKSLAQDMAQLAKDQQSTIH